MAYWSEGKVYALGWFVSGYLVCLFAYEDTIGRQYGIFRFNIYVTFYLVVFEHRCILCYL